MSLVWTIIACALSLLSQTQAQEDVSVALVVEPFEYVHYLYNWEKSAEMEVTFTEDALFGNYSMQMSFRAEQSSTAYIRSILYNGAHRCRHADYLSFWYKIVDPLETQATLQLTLYNDKECMASAVDRSSECLIPQNLDNYTFEVSLDPAQEEWQEYVVGYWSTPTEALDLTRIRGYELVLESESSISIQIDHMACHGGGNMFELFFLDEEDDDSESLFEDATYQEYYYLSELAANATSISFSEEGTTHFDYLVQVTESWGGFSSLSALARASAYYNFSQATNLIIDYETIEAAYPTDVLSLRIILHEISNCGEECENGGTDTKERWYSFHSVLDDVGSGQMQIPLEGDVVAGSSFWLTNWAGGLGNYRFDLEYIKGMTVELSLGATLAIGQYVTGSFEFGNMHVSTSSNSTAFGDSAACVTETDFVVSTAVENVTWYEYRATDCCEICDLDPECLIWTIVGGHCYTFSYALPGAVALRSTIVVESNVRTSSTKDETKRGDFCKKCDCLESQALIDCRGKDLLILPATFSEEWEPKILDLRENDFLSFLGTDSFNSTLMTSSLEELRVSPTLVYIDPSNFDSLINLKSFVSEDKFQFRNIITDGSDAFSEVCCDRGEYIVVGDDSLVFCEMSFDSPGIDAVYNDFQTYIDPTVVAVLTSSSNFMSEAAESAAKCGAYCEINESCDYFSYDARVKNAEHVCYQYSDSGNGTETVCCHDDHYADEAKTQPGWVSGWTPQVRHDLYNAKVLFSDDFLRGEYGELSYDVSLGDTPLRGAVWITPTIEGLDAENAVISPWQAVLYDASQSATFTVTFLDTSKTTMVEIQNTITSCDEAFKFEDSSDAVVRARFQVEPSHKTRNILVAVFACLFSFLLFVSIMLYRWSRRPDESIWKVKLEELAFGEPPQVVGRGTFGLVLLAEYRGTAVAVKRVIPPRLQKEGRKNKSNATNATNDHTGTISGDNESSLSASDRYAVTWSGSDSNLKFDATSSMNIGMDSSARSHSKSTFSTMFGTSASSSWKNMRQNFIDEMCYLSKLRHPCITTVMGAVIDPKLEPMLVMEYMQHGSLYDLLHNETMMIEGDLLLTILRDVSLGMRFLHAADPVVIHGDLKAQNILVDNKFRAKVADFGLSSKSATTATGTPYWMAPELLRGESKNTTTSDVYSFGIILYEVYSRKDPYEGEDPVEVLRDIMDRSIKKRPSMTNDIPPQIQALMAECYRDDPSLRPSFEELDIRLRREEASAVEPSQKPKSNGNSGHISLHDIFPKHVADALEAGQTVEPEQRDCVTIFFSDIISFTDISGSLEPRQVANLLDRLYTKFDELSRQHDIFKVETIGDAYMAVTNLVKDQPNDHAKRIAEFAIDAIKAANSTLIVEDDPSRGVVHIRAGFHSGPIVADVVGTRNPRYCLFGDAVNIASRMESNSKADRIHCTATAAEIVMTQAPDLPMRSRGNIPVKGKGTIHTFWVNEKASNADALGATAHSLGSMNDQLDSFLGRKRKSGLPRLGVSTRALNLRESAIDEFGV